MLSLEELEAEYDALDTYASEYAEIYTGLVGIEDNDTFSSVLEPTVKALEDIEHRANTECANALEHTENDFNWRVIMVLADKLAEARKGN